MVAPNRQKRPIDVGVSPVFDSCPFCPGSGKVPDEYTVLAYDNDFPALTHDPLLRSTESGAGGGPESLYRIAPAYGKCEVILYSSKHDASLSTIPESHIRKIVDLWAERSRSLAKDPSIKYIFLFENRGAEVGVTLRHPHGQLYAYPFIPLKIRTELENCRDYKRKQGRCLLCDMNAEEVRAGERIIAESDDFICFLPFFTDYPFGAFVAAKRHVAMIEDLGDSERDGLARMLKSLATAFDSLFERPFPYMMCVHQGPVNEPQYADSADYYHLHIEFYPPLRDVEKVKYNASSEMGAWAACNPLSVEETAAALRQAYHD
jgi:UDPglucose--hexose-1-phosphate uridylyltransferase